MKHLLSTIAAIGQANSDDIKIATLENKIVALENEQILSSAALNISTNALKFIAAPTYGTELCNTQEENNEILAGYMFMHQRAARDALSKLSESGQSSQDESEVSQLKARLKERDDWIAVLEQSVSILFESSECRGDEDCDHCYVTALMNPIKNRRKMKSHD